MLKLRRIELLGFKSFSDRGEIAVQDSGVTAIVGPNGCGKSNVSDAIAWVLGEQSAKSLRGEKMEDVIFNGTRHRPAMGMAQVTITLTQVGPDTSGLAGNGNGHKSGNGAAGAAAEAAGPTPAKVPGNGNGHHGNGNGHSNGNGNGSGSVHHGPSAGPRDIVVQRRLYRNGESLYLIDGKPCRLRDIHDIFLGTGLGPNSYAIIEQGRVGQLLSSKPLDRRALIEEAAGITKFKSKRRLAESRLEAARQNLSRVNDILAEVDRHRNSLKRQAGKARRYIELRDRMREILSAIFSTRAELLVYQQDAVETELLSTADQGKELENRIEQVSVLVHACRSRVAADEGELNEARTRHSEVELEHEKATQRIERFQDQIRVLEERKSAFAEERVRIGTELTNNDDQQKARTAQLAEIEVEKAGIAETIARIKTALAELVELRSKEDRAIEELRRRQMDVIGQEARTRNEIASRRDMIQRLAVQLERLDREAAEAEEAAARIEGSLTSARTEHSEHQAGMLQLRARLGEVEKECVDLRERHAAALKAVTAAKSSQGAIRSRLDTIGQLAASRAYSTESVQQFFSYVRKLDWQPLGMLADFIEVDPSYEAIVEDFLRRELQYVVVQDTEQADKALAIVKEATKGRLECLVLDGPAPEAPADSGSVLEPPAQELPGAVPLVHVLRLDSRLRHFAGSLRNVYIVDTVSLAWDLADRHPEYRFVVKTGEVVQGRVIGWGEHQALGPLALKREIRQLEQQAELAAAETAARESEALELADNVRDAEARKASLIAQVQEAEKSILTADHFVRTLVADLSRADQRKRVARSEIERFTEERSELERAIEAAEAQLASIGESKDKLGAEMTACAARSETLGADVEVRRREMAGTQATLAVLEERLATVKRELSGLQHQAADLEQRRTRAGVQIQQAEQQQDETRNNVSLLEESRYELVCERDRLAEAVAEMVTRLDALRQELTDAELKWDETRTSFDGWKDRHNSLEIERTKVDSDLKHLTSTCWSELNETIESVCLKTFDTLPVDELELREQEYTEIREKMDSMGAVNMMAVEEHQEAEQRFGFLSGQRQDLIDSIRDTAQAIEEIDAVCRKQFKEAFEAIDSGFREAFVHLFGGGHGELRLLDEAGESDAGVEIVAQPPGKKLQNVLLLSGGEKALTALALLIALFRFRPSPFCVLDEVDAPLDEANVDRFANMVREMSRQTQFIVITHSKRTMETASALYGVTMQEPGISKIVSVRLN